MRRLSVPLAVFLILLSVVPSVFAVTVRGLGGPVELNFTAADLKAQGCAVHGGAYPVALNYAPFLKDHSLVDRSRSVRLRFSDLAQSSLWCDKEDATVVRAKIIAFQAAGVYADPSLSSSIKAFVSVQPTRTSFSAAKATTLSMHLVGNEADSPESLTDLNRLLALGFTNVRSVRLFPATPDGFSVSYAGKRRDEIRIRGDFSVRLDDAGVFNVTIPVVLRVSSGALDCGKLVKGQSSGCMFRYVPGMTIRFEPVQTAALEIDGQSGQLCQSGQCSTLVVKQSSDGGYGVMVGGLLVAVIPYDQMAAAFGSDGQAVAAVPSTMPKALTRTTSAPQAAENAISAFIRSRFS